MNFLPLEVHNGYLGTQTLVIREPMSRFLCNYCEGRNSCSLKDKDNEISSLEFGPKYRTAIFEKLTENKNITNILFLLGEDTLVLNRKELFSLSKSIFDFDKTLTQTLFTNVELKDLFQFKLAYKYLTYVDYIMQTTYIKYDCCSDYLNCIYDNASYINLTESFNAGKAVYKNL